MMSWAGFIDYSHEEIIEWRDDLNERVIYLKRQVEEGKIEAWTIEREEWTLEELNKYIIKYIEK